MRRILIMGMVAITCLSSVAQTKKPTATATTKDNPEGYNIPITLSPYKNTWIYLGNYFGKYKNLSDSAWVNEKSEGVFKGEKKLPQGIYFVVSPAKYLLFEFLMDKEQHFSLAADTTNLNKFTIKGSLDNQLFQDYTYFLAEKSPAIMGLQQSLSAAKTAKDSAAIRKDLVSANNQLEEYRQNIIKNHANSMLAGFFQTMKRPETPPVPLVNGKPDSVYPYRYVKDHWWDDVSFENESLVRTPFFDPKVEEYFKYYVVPDADSIFSEANYMLLLSRSNKELFNYLLGKFTDKYINPEFMGQEKVFLKLFDNYYSKGDTAWLTEKQRKYIFDRAYSLMANQLGEPAAELNMIDTAGKAVSLYGITSPYTFVVFWDPNCGHCKETVPRVDSIYEAKWKALGVKIVGVNVDDAVNTEWKKFIVDHKLKDWYHIYQPKSVKEEEAKKNIANYRQLYDVFKTPTLYLLDSQKRIIGKMLGIEQFDDVLMAKIKSQKTTK